MTLPRRVFITGANGFIGRALAQRYRALGAEVAGVDLRADPAWGVSAGNLLDPEPWRAGLRGSDVVLPVTPQDGRAIPKPVASAAEGYTTIATRL